MKSLTGLAMPFAITSLVLYSCGERPGGQSWGAGSAQPFPVLAVAPSEAHLSQEYPARIEGRENVEIRPKVDGFIEEIYVDEGAHVRKGQRLFRLQAPQYEQEVRTAQAAIASAEAAVNSARLRLKKAQPLVTQGIVNEFEIEEAQYHLQSQEALLQQAKASLVNAQVNLGYTLILSPIDGEVGRIPFKTGSLVSSASPLPLTTVSDIRRLYAYFSIDEKQFLSFLGSYPGNTLPEKIRQFPPITLVLADGTTLPEQGSLETVGGLIDAATGAASFRAGFNNPTGIVRSGASGTVRVDRLLRNAIVIPQSATYDIQNKIFVYVVGADSLVKSREIFAHPVAGHRDYVLDSGLVAGDKIVLEGMGGLHDGVQIIPTDPAKMAPTGQASGHH